LIEAISRVEGDVAGMNVEHEDAVGFEFSKEGLDFGPAGFELLGLLLAPVGHDSSENSGARRKARRKGSHPEPNVIGERPFFSTLFSADFSAFSPPLFSA